MCFMDQERMDLWHDLERDRELMTRDGKYYVADGVLMNRNLEQLKTIDELTTENHKLRELVRGLEWCHDDQRGACYDCPIGGKRIGRCERMMRELGIKEER